MPRRDPQNPYAEHAHGRSFDKGSHGSVAKRHTNYKKADRVVSRITKEIQGVGLQRR
jgi:hypothetical protein